MRGGSRRRRRLNLALGAVGLAVFSVLAMALLVGGLRGLSESLSSLDPRLLAAATGFILASDAVKAVRLQLIMREAGYRLRFRHALAARLLGRFMGFLTPGSVGATPGRAAVVGAYTGAPLGTALGASVLETLADSAMAAFIAAAASVPLLPRSLLLLLLAFSAVGLWLLGVIAAANEGLAARLYRRMRLPQSLMERAECQRRLLLEALGEVRDPGFSAKLAALTLASHLVEAGSAAVLVWGSYGPLRALVASLAAVEAAYIAGIFPTPGGGGAVEYAVALFISPRAMIYWRLGHLLAGFAPALLMLAVIPGLRAYLREGALNGGPCGRREDIRHARPPLRVQRR